MTDSQGSRHRLQTGCTSLKSPLPILAALDLQVQDFNKPVFLLFLSSHTWPILVALS